MLYCHMSEDGGFTLICVRTIGTGPIPCVGPIKIVQLEGRIGKVLRDEVLQHVIQLRMRGGGGTQLVKIAVC